MSVLSRRAPAGSPPGAETSQTGDVAPSAGRPDGRPPALDESTAAAGTKRPLYPRLLRLRHVAPNAWQRAALGEGALAVAALLVLADLATAWTLVVLPLAVAAVVKAHDLLAGRLAGDPGRPDRELTGG